MGLRLITEPAVEPVTIEEAKKQCELSDSDTVHDDQLVRLIRTCRRDVERHTRRALITQTWRLTGSQFASDRIYLPRPPLVSVSDFTIVDGDGDSVELTEGTDYEVCDSDQPGFVKPVYGGSWPSIRETIDAISIEYEAGFGTDRVSVPEEYRQLILELIAFRFHARGDAEAKIPTHIKWSMDALKCGVFGDFYGIKQ